jgi:serine/threonine protein kinase
LAQEPAPGRITGVAQRTRSPGKCHAIPLIQSRHVFCGDTKVALETTSDRNFACFSCGGWSSKDINDVCPKCAVSLRVGESISNLPIDSYVLQEYVGRGFYGATYRAINRIGKQYAFKICPKCIYEAQLKDFDEEVRRYRDIGNHPNIAELIDAGAGLVRFGPHDVPINYAVMEWVEGTKLNEFLRDTQFSVADLYSLVSDLTAAVAWLEAKNLWHNDLNADNILIRELQEDQIHSRYVESKFLATVVDFGSTVFRQFEKHRPLDDIRFLARHINSMRQILLRRAAVLPKGDRFFVDEIDKVIAHALDEDPGRSLTTASSLMSEVKALYDRRLALDEDSSVQLSGGCK